MQLPSQAKNLIEQHSLNELLRDCGIDGKTMSLTASVLHQMLPAIRIETGDRPDWASLFLNDAERRLKPVEIGLLKAVISWHESLLVFGFMETAGVGPDRAKRFARAVRSQNLSRDVVLNMLRVAPDESIQRLIVKAQDNKEVLALIHAEVARRRRRTRFSMEKPFRSSGSDTAPNRPISVLMRNWLRAPNGAPALTFWSWSALDQLLKPSSADCSGEYSKSLARELGLVKAASFIWGFKELPTGVQLMFGIDPSTGKRPRKPVLWPSNPYRVASRTVSTPP
jgi:hypothetical protein